MTRSKESRVRSFITGEKGTNRVRLYPHPRDGILFLEYYAEDGSRQRVSLHHRDLGVGKQAAEDLAAELRKTGGANRTAVLTLGSLFDKYVRVVTPTKSEGKQQHDQAARKLFERCWGADTPVRDLGEDEWNRFIDQRRSGELAPPGPRGRARRDERDDDHRVGGGVRDRQIQFDLAFMRAVLHWAMMTGSNGSRGRLLDADPFHGLKKPSEESPCRPLTTDDEYQLLLGAADRLGEADPALFLVLAHETGHRGVQHRRLRWSDFDAQARTMRWRKPPTRNAYDKKNFDHTVPLSDVAVNALITAQRKSGRIGDALIFSSLDGVTDKEARRVVLRWWKRLEREAGLPHVHGRGWHSLRRNWATEFKYGDAPVADVARLGGWKDTDTLTGVYMRPDDHTMRGLFAKRRPVKRSVS
jgi:integrase